MDKRQYSSILDAPIEPIPESIKHTAMLTIVSRHDNATSLILLKMLGLTND